MKAEFILQLLFSGDYDNLTVKEFANIVNKHTDGQFSDDVQIEKDEEDRLMALDIEDEYEKASFNNGTLI